MTMCSFFPHVDDYMKALSLFDTLALMAPEDLWGTTEKRKAKDEEKNKQTNLQKNKNPPFYRYYKLLAKPRETVF